MNLVPPLWVVQGIEARSDVGWMVAWAYLTAVMIVLLVFALRAWGRGNDRRH